MAIRATHVGSLPRSQEVADLLFARERGEAYDQEAFDAVMTAAVADTVRRQTAAGIDIVSDGETSKISYATYVKDRYDGFSGDTARNPPADLLQFPSYMRRLAAGGGTPQYARPACTSEVRATASGRRALQQDIANLQAAMQTNGARRGFMNAASPGVIALFLPNRFYASREEYLAALAAALRDDYRAIVAAGLTLQIDCPDLALSRHMLFADLPDEEFVSIARQNVEALNSALDGIDKTAVRAHICWGNYEGPHTCDIGIDKMFETLFAIDAGAVLFESANPRHAHEWAVFAARAADIPDDTVLIPGVIDTTTNFVEHPRLVAQRLRRFTDIVGAERVIAGSDCGFGTFAGFGAVDADIAYAKLAALSEGAKLAAG